MLNQLFTTDGIILFPLAAAFAVTAVIYFFRLLGSLIFKSRRKYTYHGLWLPPYLLFLACLQHSCGYSSRFWLSLMLALWLFSSACAIIQIKVSMKKSWKLIWEDAMKRAIIWIARLRSLLFWIAAKCSRLQGILIWVFIVGLIAISCWAPQFGPVYLILSAFVAFLTGLSRCVSSCRSLLIFWLGHSVIGAYLIYSILVRTLPSDIGDSSIPLAYCFICALLIVFWCLSAGVADHDVAKMAGAIINTTTTILLIAANIFFGWFQWNVAPNLVIDSDEALYVVNFMIFPIVAAGYLAMLFVDGLEYCRKRLKPLDTGNSDPESDKTNL